MGLKRVKALVALFLSTFFLFVLASFYRAHWHEEKQRADQAIEKTKSLQLSLERLESQQKAVAEIDKHYTQELAKANEQIEKMRSDLVTGRKRLYVKAECPKLPETTTATRLGNAALPRLGRDAEQNYLLLREQVIQMQKQLEALQEYIKQIQK